MKVLPDTSIWVDFLREGARGPAASLEGLLDRESVYVCGPVIAELLAGAAVNEREKLWLALGNLPWADLDRAGWRRTGEVASALRSAGAAVPLTDVEIAVASAAAGATVWTQDTDFQRIAEVFPELKLYSP